MASVYEQIEAEVKAVVAHYKELAKDGLSLMEIWELTIRVIATLIRLADTVSGATGPEKKAAVQQGASLFFDSVIAPLDLPWVPDLLEKTVVDPMFKKFFLNVVDGLVEGLLKVLWKGHEAGPF